jgi:hypothetical protein
MQPIFNRSAITVCFAIPPLLLSTAAAFSQIVVDDAALSTSEILAEAPVVGYRAFPKNGLVSLDPKKDRWAVDGAVLYGAAAADVDFQQQTGKSTSEMLALPLQDLVSLYKRAPKPSNTAPCSAGLKSNMASFDCPVWDSMVVDVKGAPRLSDSKLDTKIVRLAFAVGAFDEASISTLPVMGSGGAPAVGVTIDPKFAKRASGLYGSADKLSTARQDPSTAFEFGEVTKVALQDTSVSQVAAVLLATVAIGKPLILTAKEKGLQLPSSISAAFDVYWMQLAVNPRSDLRGKVDELSFFVSLKTPDSEALELVPLRYGDEQEVKSTTAVPQVELKAGEIGVTVGQIYSQEVSYKTLKPTIVGTGIQASEFGWSLSHEMVDMSAKRLIAIVGVPKKASKLDFDMIVNVRTNPSGWWGSVEGNVASTGPQRVSALLPQSR